MDDDDEDDFEDDEGDSDDDDGGGVDFERKARQTVARLARQAKESDMEMNTMQDQGFAMPTVEELAAEGEMPADITMLTARVKGTVRLCIYTTNLNPNPNPNPNPNSNPNQGLYLLLLAALQRLDQCELLPLEVGQPK